MHRSDGAKPAAMRRINYKGLRIGWALRSASKNPSNTRICPNCKSVFIRRGNRKFGCSNVCCSKQCSNSMQKGRKIPGFNVKQKSGLVVFCKTCGKSFQHPPSRTAKYCSLKCRELDASSFDGIRGKKHYNWKGGVTPINVKLRNSPAYRAWTLNVFRRDAFKCRICGKGRTIQAHHIYPWATHPSNRLDLWNGITLCKPCHKAIHLFGRIVTKRINTILNSDLYDDYCEY